MADYAFVMNGKAYTPNQTPVRAEDVAAHNAAIERAELDYWATQPDRMLAYYSFPADRAQGVRGYVGTFDPLLTGARVNTWTGVTIGRVSSAHVYLHNFGSRMIALTVTGTNGANYYGRASWDHGDCITLRKVKA